MKDNGRDWDSVGKGADNVKGCFGFIFMIVALFVLIVFAPGALLGGILLAFAALIVYGIILGLKEHYEKNNL